MSKHRADSFGMFWEDVPKVKASTAKVAPPKMLPPPLRNAIDWRAPTTRIPVLKPSVTPIAILDVECYYNYFLISIMRLSDGKIKSFEITETVGLDTYELNKLLDEYEIITFNGNNYDIPVIRLAISGASTALLKSVSDRIINEQLRPYSLEKEFKLPELSIKHIDLIELAPGQVSLKIYGARLGCKKLQDLPIKPNEILTNEQMKEIKTYCANDLEVTKTLFLELQDQIMLRRNMSNQYKTDLRSKSDAQIAEEIIKTEFMRLTGKRPGSVKVVPKTFLYEIPEFIKFSGIELNNVLLLLSEKPFTVTAKGSTEMPRELLTLQVKLGQSTYQMGMGGLHSTEASCYHVSDTKYLLKDSDVVSYYPQIILNCGLYPPTLGKSFLDVYQRVVTERVAAKHNGDKVKANALKICVNGTFGKLGSSYSALYAPELMVQVTVTGQLSLLMLIEQLESAGIAVVSANTDGIVTKCPVGLEKLHATITEQWEQQTGFTMEHSEYLGLYSKNVNNYIAIKYNSEVKTKGCFSSGTLSKNPQNEICNIAMIAYLTTGKNFKDSIMECRDISKFVSVRTVKGGALYKGKYLGKAIRWYYAKNCKDSITYQTNGNLVPRSYGAKPVMDMDAFPDDIDYDWYVKECYNLF